jgi:Zn-dependent protease with chaperone function
MKFTARRLREEVNVSREHPLKELCILAGGILGGFLLLYLLLGFALELVVPRIDPALEEYLGKLMLPVLVEEGEAPRVQEKLQGLLDDIASIKGEPDRDYRVHLSLSPKANAMALPGGHIVVLEGLVGEAESENELAMVLGHELGHFRNRDHLRGLGRGLVLIFLSSLLFGTDSSLSSLATSLLSGAETQFSQHQELQADLWGLELLVGRYGHAGGATGFFRRLAEKEEGSELTYLFASHPYPKERVEALEETIREQGYPLRETVPLDEAFGVTGPPRGEKGE